MFNRIYEDFVKRRSLIDQVRLYLLSKKVLHYLIDKIRSDDDILNHSKVKKAVKPFFAKLPEENALVNIITISEQNKAAKCIGKSRVGTSYWRLFFLALV